ncbi:MAG: tRNA nucleotidyltransferase [Flavobacteriaceae bacterium]|nr:tRNA nucleotidyltransferase [Flavobacteriaceae bacterium]|tara:strand:+ start:1388 stop:2821 length:1434 start_codon:yes stop_codon:yes gene_type:complete
MVSISTKKILNHKLFKTIKMVIEECGIESYIIGGFVRDFILIKENSKDIDFLCADSGIKLAKLLKKALVNSSKIKIFKNYGTAMFSWNGFKLEFVGARKESYNFNSRNPVVEKGSILDDQKRRDFTINSIAISLNKTNYGKIIDPCNGIEDIKKRILRTPLNPNKTYNDDPLRMLRAIRFSSNLNFKIEEKSLEAIYNNVNRINIISKERIVDELNKIILSPKPSLGFLILDKTGLLNKIIPEVSNLKGVEEVEGYSHKENFYHTLEVLDNISLKTDNLWLRWAALLHDIGKVPTKKLIPGSGWTFHGHEFVGSKMVYKLYKRLKMPLNEKMKYVQKLVLMSSRPIVIAKEIVTDAAVRRLVFDAGDDIDDLICLCKADITTKNQKRFSKYHKNFELVTKKIIEVEEKDRIRNFQPPLDGELIMSYYGIKPCEKIGKIKESIKEAILEGKIPNNKKAAFELMKSIGKELGLAPANEK